MSQIDEQRAAIIAAIQAMSASTGVASADVRGAAAVEDVWELAVKPKMIFVVYGGLERGPSMQPLGNKLWTPATLHWIIVPVVQSYQDATSANTSTGGADTIVEAVRAIRDVQVGPSSQPKTYLMLAAEQLITPPDRPARGGPAGYAATYKTTQMFV